MAHFIRKPDRVHTAPKPIIGIHGLAGSGKDTVGTAIQANDPRMQKTSFAEPLKNMIAVMLDCEYHWVEGVTEDSRYWRERELPEIGQTPRELMLSLGTEWGRDMVHADIWCILTRRIIEKRMKAGKACYIPDVRFDNEARMIKEMGGIVIEVRRTDQKRPEPKEATLWDLLKKYAIINAGYFDAAEDAKLHRSEQGINPDLIDGYVEADKGDIDGLQSMALKLLTELECPFSY